ncbi:MAG: DUF1549 and DUF1553 domain-containing protein, partial [Pirellulaceae bacterium]
QSEGLTMRPEADRSTLIRRVALALTGLPPTVAGVDRFLADRSPRAYDTMVQQYLDSPRFGEEMARHWLDVARYADTHGLHLDNERQMWAYRDWVIQSFNRNQPFDEFTVEQLAGDLLPHPTIDQLIATGFNRCNVSTSEGGSIEAEFLYRYAVDRASTMAQAWLGLTAGCAVCHDHKYDPLTMREFYSLYAFFYSSADPAMDKNIRNTDPFLLLPSPQQEVDLARLRGEEAAARQRLLDVAGELSWSDPAELSPAASPQAMEDVWLDEAFPLGARVTNTSRNASSWVAAAEVGGPLGQRVLRQANASMYQDRFENATMPLTVPANGSWTVWLRLDPLEPSQAVMMEFVTSKGTRRALWGDAEKLGSGEIGTPERLRIGDLPTPGRWERLRVTADQLKLEGGDPVRGAALAQFGGVAYWDGLIAHGELAPAEDPRASLTAWWKSRQGQDSSAVPAELQKVVKDGPKADLPAEQRTALRKFFLAFIARPTTDTWRAARQVYDAAQAARASLEESVPGTFIFRDLAEPRQAHVMQRGQYDKPGEPVEPAVPAVFPPMRLESSRRANRLDLARWLVAPDHPLTARVAANRLWQQFFGTGLVKTSYDFGAQGEPPSHPELLDWLAIYYRDTGWNTKEFVRMLVTSAAFRQDVRVLPETLQRDPENRLYARGPRFRLDAEQIRDNALYLGGLLNLEMGGRGVKPYQPPNIWEPVGYADSNTRFYLQDHGPSIYRRSIYCFLKRTAPPPFMSNFDGPNREQFCTRRERSNTPLQALQLLNDTQHFEAARGFAQRMLREAGPTPAERITFAYRAALAREPAPEELQLLSQTLDRFLQRYAAEPAQAERVIRTGESPPVAGLAAPELAAYTLLANLILNLDETVTRG